MSDIIKSNFISFSDQKRQIKTVDKNDPNVIKSSIKSVDNKSNQNITNQGLSLDDLGLDINDIDHRLNEMQEDEALLENEQSLSHQFHEQSMELSEDALYEIESLKEEARNEGYEEGFSSGKTDGYNSGYEDGKNQAENEVNQALKAYKNEQDNELKSLKDQLIEEFESYKLELEPKMLSIIEDLVIKIIGIQKISKSTIMHLIKCGLDELELHGDLVIKVSAKDLDYVIERKNELTEELSEKIKVEILKDQQLEENECIIETEMGTIDCSLGTQLEGLLKELRLIRDSLLVD